ncbi:hypothetical protein COP2_042015 [Malus domestica]
MGASMIKRVQGQHKAHMNSLKVPTTSETSKTGEVNKVFTEGKNQIRWRTKNEVERASRKTKGEGDQAPMSLHPGKYRILRRAQEDMVMMQTPKWSPEPSCFGTILPEKKIPLPLLVDTLYESLVQVQNFGIT